MSLKTFHVVFIIFSLALAFGLGAWGTRLYWQDRAVLHLLLGGAGFFSGGLLVVYLKFVIKKYKNMSWVVVFIPLTLLSRDALACAVCYGDPNSLMAKGARMGVLALLLVTGVVLSLIGAMIFSFGRRARLWKNF